VTGGLVFLPKGCRLGLHFSLSRWLRWLG